MNKHKCISISLATIILVLLLFTFPTSLHASEQEDYQAARNENTINAWESYLKKYPESQNLKAAREAHDFLLCQEAEKSIKNPSALENLFKRCKTPDGSDKVFRLWDNALWATARETNTSEAYRGYLLRFPGGQHVKEVKVAIEEINWRQCLKSGKVEFYEAYLKEYPNGAHKKEAREAISDLEYRAAWAKDTIEGYESFLKDHYGHKAAGKRLQQLMYERAVRTGMLEHWKAFYDKYRYSRRTEDEKVIKQMRENARKEIERLLYERITAEPTLELCRDYLNRYRDGIHKQQVIVKMEPCLFDEAVRTNKLDTYFEYLEKYSEGYRDLEIRKLVDTLIFKTLDEKENFSSFEKYLRLSLKNKDFILARMEPLMFEWSKRVNTVESYNKYLVRYPKGAHLKEVQTSMDPVLFKKAQEEDWYSTYEDYIKKCPNGQSIQKARNRMAYLKSNKAIVEIEYPKVVEGAGYWKWDIVFKEKSGKLGFKITGTGYILDQRGGRWGTFGGNIGRGTVIVHAGKAGKDNYWCRDQSGHKFCNGQAIFTWTGEDAGGHSIRLEERVKLQHTGCPGPKK